MMSACLWWPNLTLMPPQLFESFTSDAPRSLMGDHWGFDEEECAHPAGTEYCIDCLFVDPEIVRRF